MNGIVAGRIYAPQGVRRQMQEALVTPEEEAILFESNIQVINQMDVAAGSMIRQVLHELERSGRNTYIRLRSPAPDGHVVGYDFVEGDETLVSRVGRGLGLTVSAHSLEVRSA